MPNFSVMIYYLSKSSPGEQSSQIIFSSKSDRQAVIDSSRWFQKRHKNLPEVFSYLACIKAYHFTLKEIDAEGYLPQSTGFCFFEWKYDWPGTFSQYLNSL